MDTKQEARKYREDLSISFLAGHVVTGLYGRTSARTANETPGRLEIAKHSPVLERSLSPPNRKLDAAKLSAKVNDMAKLARCVPSDIDQIAQGKLQKDLDDKLNHIEKISKDLRAELPLKNVLSGRSIRRSTARIENDWPRRHERHRKRPSSFHVWTRKNRPERAGGGLRRC
jgi:hypothetical protein